MGGLRDLDLQDRHRDGDGGAAARPRCVEPGPIQHGFGGARFMAEGFASWRYASLGGGIYREGSRHYFAERGERAGAGALAPAPGPAGE